MNQNDEPLAHPSFLRAVIESSLREKLASSFGQNNGIGLINKTKGSNPTAHTTQAREGTEVHYNCLPQQGINELNLHLLQGALAKMHATEKNKVSPFNFPCIKQCL